MVVASAETLSLPAPAKLNLSLGVLGKRADGMHLLQGTMLLIDLADTIHLTLRSDGKIVRDWQHEEVPQDVALVAAKQLQQAAGCDAGVTIRIDKRIPVGGGLGGASSNAATVVAGLNKLWRLNWHKDKLLNLAATLGADIPFFFHGYPAAVSGIGDVFSPKKMDINNYLLLFPPVTALTALVYAEYDRLAKLKKIDRIPPPLVKSNNELTMAAINLYPQIMQAAQVLYDIAGEARLSGSGATVFAAFARESEARQAQRQLPAGVSSAVVSGLPRHPLEWFYDTYGESPSGKAAGFDPAMRRFESYLPSQF